MSPTRPNALPRSLLAYTCMLMRRQLALFGVGAEKWRKVYFSGTFTASYSVNSRNRVRYARHLCSDASFPPIIRYIMTGSISTRYPVMVLREISRENVYI